MKPISDEMLTAIDNTFCRVNDILFTAEIWHQVRARLALAEKVVETIEHGGFCCGRIRSCRCLNREAEALCATIGDYRAGTGEK